CRREAFDGADGIDAIAFDANAPALVHGFAVEDPCRLEDRHCRCLSRDRRRRRPQDKENEKRGARGQTSDEHAADYSYEQAMELSERDRRMLDGGDGPATQLAMSILVRMADVYGAAQLMDISQAHIDSTIYLGDATLEFAERLAALGA